MGNQNNGSIVNNIEEYVPPGNPHILPHGWEVTLFVLCPRQDPQIYLFPFGENTLEALFIRFPRTPLTLQNALIAARDQLGQAFRMPNRDGMNLPSVLHPGMYYVSQNWAIRVAYHNVIPIGQSGVVGANFTTSSSVNSDDESSVESDDESSVYSGYK